MIDAAEIAKALGGRRAGRSWIAKCPAHNDRSPSLSIAVGNTGKPVVHCFAGCDPARVIDVLRGRGLWHSDDRDTRSRAIVDRQHVDDDAGRKESALAIWNTSVPASNTPVETYLRSRGITLPTPAALRFHAALRHHPTGTGWPAMVALVTGVGGGPVAIHRTYLAHDGTGKAAVTPDKMMLGSCRAGAVRLGEIVPGKNLAICEGIETALSVMQACQIPAWAALSADGMKKVVLPAGATMVLVCADNDANGAGQRAAHDAAERFRREGRIVRITMPPDAGSDFNDRLINSKERNRHG